MSDRKDIVEMSPVRHGKCTSFIDVPCGYYASCLWSDDGRGEREEV